MAEATERIEQIEREAADAIASASGTAELEELRVRFLGRKAELTRSCAASRSCPPTERGAVGKAGNEVRDALETLLEARAPSSTPRSSSSGSPGTPSTSPCPGRPPRRSGYLHLLDPDASARSRTSSSGSATG